MARKHAVLAVRPPVKLPMKPFVSIITPVKDELGYLRECIASVSMLDYPKDSYEHIVVIDKKSANANSIKALAKEKPNLIIIDGGIGSAANRNIGAAHANPKASFLAFTDADCTVDKQWLSFLVIAILQAQDAIGCVGGVNLVPYDDSSLAHLFAAMEATLLGGGGSSQGTVATAEKEVPSIPNCNALYRRTLWVDNKQDESFLVGQDGEFNHRLAKQGVRFRVVPGAIVFHHRSGTIKHYLVRMFRYGQATRRIAAKHPSILRVRWYSLGPVALIIGSILLLLVSWWSTIALTLLSGILAVYFFFIILTAIIWVIPRRGAIGFLSFILFPLQHIAYGLGFLRG